jgi:uncharacterized membrane protein YhaH (DUF805 family)
MELSPVEQAIGQFLPLALIAALSLWMTVRTLHKAGYSGWWSLLTLIPLLNIAMLWVLASAEWPALKARA